MNEKTAKITARWWRNKLENCRHDNGSKDPANFLAMMLADTLAMKNVPTKDQLDTFEKTLIDLIMQENDHTVSLYCDYHPCKLLSMAADKAGIDYSVFPWKTNTMTMETEAYASDGYTQPYVEIHECILN